MEAGVAVLHERRAGRECEQVGKEHPDGVADADRAIRSADTDVDVEPEAVVTPHDVAEDLVVAAVVRRVDDALLLPWAPGVCPGRRERDSEPVREGRELVAPLRDARRRLREAFTATGADLDLGGDQLTDEVSFQVGADGRLEQLLEAIRQRERDGVEQRELLLDGEREVSAGVELLAGEPDLLVRG